MNLNALSVYLVTDRSLCLGRPLDEVVAQAVAGGCTMVQLREKHLDTGEFVELARALKNRLEPLGVPLVINDRVDIALAAGVQGVHVGQKDMKPADIRSLMGSDIIVGLSVETDEELAAAQNEPVDYLGIGPVYPTQTKKDVKGKPWRPEGLLRAVKMSRLPLVGIAGIDQSNARDVVISGVEGVAVVSAICSAPSPEQAAADLLKAVQEGKTQRKAKSPK